jgi:tetratricopeptide (TPR) repeat protein
MKGQDGFYAAPFIKEGLGHAARALEKNPNDARVQELRGTLRYWSWLLHLEPDKTKAAALLKDAEQDLRRAVQLDRSLAGAWGTLSHLDYQKSDVVTAKLDAQQAYDADAYYGSAETILWRLYTASYDLEQFLDAQRWCAEGQRRLPGTPRFLQCQLWLLTTKAEEPDVPKAWGLVDALSKVTPPREWPFEKLKDQIAVAAVLTRAGQADSARHLLVQSRGNPEVDPTHGLPYYEAFVRTMLGDRDEAIRQLKQWLAAQPERRSELANDYQWWFRDLRGDPRYRELAGAGQ